MTKERFPVMRHKTTKTSRPRLLDLFCKAGGASMGYYGAGFDVVGVDIEPQPHYPFEFVQAEALEYLSQYGHEFDAIHASPPCQGYSRMRHLPWLRNNQYPMLIEPTRLQLVKTAKPWVIENVQDAHLPAAYLCGGMFGKPFFMHRYFETPFLFLQPPHAKHNWVLQPGRMLGDRARAGHQLADIGIDWMTKKEMAQAVPPVYTEFIGEQLLAVLR